ncbi:MAG: RidA family protein [Anaerolineae bacterium]|nr:RidA family protein [Anaerolineae bacterium]
MELRVINPWQWQDALGFVQAIAVKDERRSLMCSGQTAMSAEGQPMYPGDMAAQVNMALDNLEIVLEEADFKLSDVVRLNYYVTDVDAFIANHSRMIARLDKAGCRPTATLLGVSRLAFPELMVEIEATAVA